MSRARLLDLAAVLAFGVALGCELLLIRMGM